MNVRATAPGRQWEAMGFLAILVVAIILISVIGANAALTEAVLQILIAYWTAHLAARAGTSLSDR